MEIQMEMPFQMVNIILLTKTKRSCLYMVAFKEHSFQDFIH